MVEQSQKPLIPDTLDPAVRPFIDEVRQRFNDRIFVQSPYGHAAINLAEGLRLRAEDSPEEQRKFLRERALSLVKRHGTKIITFMRDELRFSLTDEDLGVCNEVKSG